MAEKGENRNPILGLMAEFNNDVDWAVDLYEHRNDRDYLEREISARAPDLGVGPAALARLQDDDTWHHLAQLHATFNEPHVYIN